MKNEIIQRFVSYVKINTQSDENNPVCPSTKGQLMLANNLVEELRKIGMKDVSVDENGYVMATLPANTEKKVPVIGFLAHVDTATDFTGDGVNPQIVENYNGEALTLNNDIILSPADFPSLSNYKGQTIITTDGTTLLGADNKAGIAEIMTAMAYLIQHPEIKHGKVRIAFTPDEEIGRGPHKFDVGAFGANFAYTIDGGPLGELQYESFNAAGVKLTFKGTNIHPGTAKGTMVNAAKIAMEFNSRLPIGESPELTEGYEGFYHLLAFNGDVEVTKLTYIIRDFDRDQFEARKTNVKKIVNELREQYGHERIVLEMTDQYYNMGEKITPVIEIVDIASDAMKRLDIKPLISPIRGGTDGSQLSYLGLPTPNIFTGGENFHGPYEFISVESMEKAVKVIVEIVNLFEDRA
ncbi:peptidase T [Bacillus sp. FSL K6-3431]|uniref:peptidase T n=1 Tax=Bacillus sp. FSL K6-3431 TaxID=2921500 RepID=UPI0030FADBEB